MRFPITLVAIAPTISTTRAVVRMPRPGTSRPIHCAYHGPTNPSINRKIQKNAATLITSGTVTNKPAMNRPRSHWIIELLLHQPHDRRRGEREPVHREDVQLV